MPLPVSTSAGFSEVANRVNLAIDFLRETQSIEFKESQPWEILRILIAKTSMAMSNLRDGGMIVIGIKEDKQSWVLQGVDATIKATYEPDDISEFIARFSSPTTTVHSFEHPYKGLSFVVIVVDAFQETPTVVKRDAPDNQAGKPSFRKGDFLIRPSGKPQTIKVEDETHMHSLIEIAAERRSQRFLRSAHNLGLSAPPEAAILFRDQRKEVHIPDGQFDGLATWTYFFYGDTFSADTIESISALKRLILDNHVALRGWDFPSSPQHDKDFITDQDSLACYIDFLGKEFWQAWRSGQFYYREAIEERRHAAFTRNLRGSQNVRLTGTQDAPGFIEIISVLYRFIELHMFIGRLVNSGMFDNRVHLTILLSDAIGFVMTMPPDRLQRSAPAVSSKNLKLTFTYGVDETQHSFKEITLKAFNRMLESAFGWTDLPLDAFARDFDKFTNQRKLGWDTL